MEKAMWWVVGACMVLVAVQAAEGAAETSSSSCSKVAKALKPCRTFVLHGGATPPSSCCHGLKTLYDTASTVDRQVSCSCLKSIAGSATPFVIANAALLPTKCGVSIPYKISPSTDCGTIR